MFLSKGINHRILKTVSLCLLLFVKNTYISLIFYFTAATLGKSSHLIRDVVSIAQSLSKRKIPKTYTSKQTFPNNNELFSLRDLLIPLSTEILDSNLKQTQRNPEQQHNKTEN